MSNRATTVHVLFAITYGNVARPRWRNLPEACHLYAGSAYNQAGRSSGLTAPNGPAQTLLVKTALAYARLTPQDIASVSLHGTGTPLGALSSHTLHLLVPAVFATCMQKFARQTWQCTMDRSDRGSNRGGEMWQVWTGAGDPIEVGALGQALAAKPGRQTRVTLGEYTSTLLGAAGLKVAEADLDLFACLNLLKTFWSKSFTRLQRVGCWNPQRGVHAASGSVKACYGHTEGVAGIHGALLSILTANSRAAPPIMHLRTVNPYVSSALSDWRGESRVEAIVPRVKPRHTQLFHFPHLIAMATPRRKTIEMRDCSTADARV